MGIDVLGNCSTKLEGLVIKTFQIQEIAMECEFFSPFNSGREFWSKQLPKGILPPETQAGLKVPHL